MRVPIGQNGKLQKRGDGLPNKLLLVGDAVDQRHGRQVLRGRVVDAGQALGGCAVREDALPRLKAADLDRAGRPQASRVAHGRTRMIVFPARRSVGLKAATASSRVETLPMFVRSRPSRTRRTISLSWAPPAVGGPCFGRAGDGHQR